ncbi:MAG: hypothetical protein BroJett025_00280 [Patescibacteria group bacterium]|nr:MAG: hypothetical protein BroJett025_00280 [Patescibacteria group bacterium]
MIQKHLHETPAPYIPEGLGKELEEGLASPEITQTHRRELIFKAMLEKLAQNPDASFDARQLALIYRHYANSLLLHDIDAQHHALHSEEWTNLKRTNEDLAGEFSYAVLRLVSKEDVIKLSNADVFFTDDEEYFMNLPNNKVKRADARGRLYSIEELPNGLSKFTFFVRRTDTLQPSTDALEILSLICVIELARKRMKSTKKQDKNAMVYRRALEKTTKKAWDLKEIKQWASQKGITIRSSQYGLRDYQTAPKLETTTHYKVVEQIKERLAEKRLSTPQAAILGNEFALPILAAIGIFSQEEMDILQSDKNIKDPLEALNGTIKPEKLTPEQQELVRRFGYLQYLNRYSGENKLYLALKEELARVINSLKTPLFSADETTLADPIDHYNFGNLDQANIDHIPEESIRNILQDAKNRNFTMLNFCYPLGDNTYGLVKSLKAVMGTESIGFFGKVGATIDYLDDGARSGVKVGRIVLPENTVANSPDAKGETFLNRLIPEDVAIIPAGDETEVILQVNGVLLQSIEDIKFIREKLANREILVRNDRGEVINPKKIRILLDMESHHLHLACKDIGIIPIVCYYTSDNTKVPPTKVEQSHGETLVTSLGERGSFATLASAATVLHGILQIS